MTDLPDRFPHDLVGSVIFAEELTSMMFMYLVGRGTLPADEALTYLDVLRLRFETLRNDPSHRLAKSYDRALSKLDDLVAGMQVAPPSAPPAS